MKYWLKTILFNWWSWDIVNILQRIGGIVQAIWKNLPLEVVWYRRTGKKLVGFLKIR